MSFIRKKPVESIIDLDLSRNAYVYDDHWISIVPSWASSDIVGTGAGLLNSGAVTTSKNVGVVGLYTGTTSTGRCGFRTHVDGVQFGANEWYFASRANILNLGNVTDNFTVRFGFMDSTAADSVDGHYFRYNYNSNGGRWEAITRNNSLETATDTGIAGTAMTSGDPMPRFSITVSASGTEVIFKIDDDQVARHTPAGFTGSSRLTGIGYSIVKSAGTNSRAFFVDYTYFACRLGAKR